jgi:PAS domain S-box-containing protein
MKNHNRISERYIIFTWVLLVLSFAVIFVINPVNPYRIVYFVILSALLILNIILTTLCIKQYSHKQSTAGKNDNLNKEDWLEKENNFLQTVEKLKSENEFLKTQLKAHPDSPEVSITDSQEIETRQGDFLWNLSMTLTGDLDLMTILSSLLEKLKSITGYCSASVFLYNRDFSELTMPLHVGLYENEMKLNLRPDIGIPGIVSRTGKLIYIPDTSADPRFREIQKSADFGSALYLPVKADTRVAGVICLWNKNRNSYNTDTLKLLSMISKAAARAIKNAELYKALDTRLNFIVTLWEATKSLTSSLDLSFSWENVFEDRLKTTSYLFHADKVIFFQYKSETRELVPYITWNISDETKENFIIKLKQEPIILSEYMRSIFQVNDVTVDSKYSSILPHVQKENVKGMLWSPLMGRNRVIGTLALFSTEARKWTKEETQWLEIFANFFSMTLENVRLLNDLFSEKNQLQKLVDNVPEGVFTTDTDGKIIIWNRAAEAITGYSAVETVNKWCGDVIKCRNRSELLCDLKCFVKRSMETKEKVDSGLEDVFIIHKNKHSVPVFIASVPINDEDGNVVGTIVVFRDITEEKEIEQMKEEFLATITHDLKSPLASIMGYIELILNPNLGELNNEQREFADAILRSGKTLQILINNILESTRMEAGKVNLHPVLFKLQSLVKEIEEMFRPLFNHKMLSFNIDMDSSIMAYGDRDKIKEVFINLISNAVKFTPESGQINISARNREDEDVVEIKVSDTGTGIPDTAIPTLFKKFSQVKGQKRGTGLGLYICRKILEVHNHTIRVESRIGEGTIFTFTLSRKRTDTRCTGRKCILVVIKDESLKGEISLHFEKNDYKVISAKDLAGTKDILELEDKEMHPGAILLDWHLSSRESLFILGLIRENAKWQELPVIVLCEKQEELDGDYDALVRKPLDLSELYAKTDTFING